MAPFLSQVISDLYKKLNGDFSNLTIIFPNKRAGLFVNQYLSQLSSKPIWAPRYTTINEFFSSLSDKKIPDTIELVIHLYNAYIQSYKNAKVTLETFYGWGEILLNDFQDIDNNMVPAKELFDNVSALNNLERLDYLSLEQINAIKTFFTDFDPDDTNEMRKRFADMWNSMYDIYTRFKHSLAEKGLAYEAMLKREVIESIDSNLRSSDHQTYAIVGFNVLSETEKLLFHHLSNSSHTYFYWDYDPAFIKHEAARFIQENIKLFGNELPNQAPPHITNIHIYTANSDTAQASFASDWVADTPPLSPSALILADENLLLPVLQQIPACPLNITMGYPLRQTPIASLITSLINLRSRGAKNQSLHYYHTFVTPILRHPYIHKLAPTETISISKYMKEHNMMYTTQRLFTDNKLLQHIFCSTQPLLPYLQTIIKEIGLLFKFQDDPLATEAIFQTYQLITNLRSHISNLQSPISNLQLEAKLLTDLISSQTVAFHGEPIAGFQIMGMLETRNLDFTNLLILSANEGMLPKISHSASFIPYFLRNFYSLTTIEKQTSLYAYYFYRLLQRAENVSIIYNGFSEGLKKNEISRFLLQLQIEQELPVNITTHTLEFKDSSSSRDSRDSRDSSDSSDSSDSRENSQLSIINDQFEAKPISPSALATYIECPLKYYFAYIAHLEPEEEMSDEIENSTFGNIIHYVMQKIYTPFLGKYITAAQLTEMMADEALIAKLVDQAFAIHLFKNEIQNSKFKIQNSPIPQTPPSPGSSYRRSDERVEECISPSAQENNSQFEAKPLSGEQYLNRQVIIKYIKSQLHYDSTLAPIFIEALEKKVETPTIYGRIDRIDRITIDGQEVRRIVDYKTSSTQQKPADLDDLFTSNPNHPASHLFQVLCYAEMLTQNEEEFKSSKPLPLTPTLNYIKLVKSPHFQPVIKIDKTLITDYSTQLRDMFVPRLTSLIEEVQEFNSSKGSELPTTPGLSRRAEDECVSPSAQASTSAQENNYQFSILNSQLGEASASSCKYCDFQQICKITGLTSK